MGKRKHEVNPPTPTGMSDDDLLAFNPIISAAFGKFVSENDEEAIEMVKPIPCVRHQDRR